VISDQWGVLSQEWERREKGGRRREVKSKKLTASTMMTSETSRDRKMIIMKPIESVKLFIADDHEITCLGLKTLISQQPHCQVVGIAVNGQ